MRQKCDTACKNKCKKIKNKQFLKINIKKTANMESCFPPLAALSLRGSSGSKGQKNRHSTGGVQPAHDDIRLQNHKDFLPKLEVLQDLDLYYIRQIASSLKVRNI